MFEYLQKENHNISGKKDNKQGRLEKLISSGARYLDKTLKILTLTTAITAATFLSGCEGQSSEETGNKSSVTVSQTEVQKKEVEKEVEKKPLMPYEEEFDIPAYVINRDKESSFPERNKLLDTNAKIKIEKNSDTNGIQIGLFLDDYDQKNHNPDSRLYLDALESSPMIIHPPEMKIANISQRAFVNLGGNKKDWQSLSYPYRDEDYTEGIDVTDKLEGALGEIIFTGDSKSFLYGSAGFWWAGLISELKENKNQQEELQKLVEEGYEFSLILNHNHKLRWAKDNETARKYWVRFDQNTSRKKDIWVLQGIRLKNESETGAFGTLERRLIGPINMGEEINLSKHKEGEEIDLWKYKEGEDFEWFDKDYSQYIIYDPEKEETMLSLDFRSIIKDPKTNKTLPYYSFSKKSDYKINFGLYGEKKLLAKEEIYLAQKIVNSWGEHKSEIGPFEDGITGMIEIGRNEEELGKRYIGEIILIRKLNRELERLERYGVPTVYTLKKGEKELKPAIQEKKDHRIRFLTRDNYSGLDELDLGVFPAKNGEIQGEPFLFTRGIVKYLRNKEEGFMGELKFSENLEPMYDKCDYCYKAHKSK